MDILEIEKIIKNFSDLSFIGLSFKLPVYTEGDFFIFTEKGDDIYKISGWNNIKLIIPQLPSSLDVYITDVNLAAMICLTSEDNVIISGKNPFTR